MALSNDVISQFVKITNDRQKQDKKETITYGRVSKKVDSQVYVVLDGTHKNSDGTESEVPVSTTVNVEVGNRVIVMIKNHSAVITGNLGRPAVNEDYVDATTGEIKQSAQSAEQAANEASSKVDQFGVLIANKVDTDEFTAKIASIENLEVDTVLSQTVKAISAAVVTLSADNVEIRKLLNAEQATIEELKTSKLDAETASITYATIANLSATNTEVNNLKAAHANFETATANKFTAVDANISKLSTSKLDAESAKVIYANIDFSNIGEAAIRKFFSESGMIDNLVVADGTVTGKLVGVTISGDLIEGNTVKAEKLVVKGSDGLYYKLNIEAGATTSEKVTEADLQNGLHGTAIIAKTITAEKISVSDLVAFGATIGGFKISEDSIYSGAKSSVGNTTQGVYLDSTGQMAVGDSNNFIKYYKASDGSYKLEISASSILLGSSKKSVETAIMDAVQDADAAQTTANEANEKASNAQTLIAQLSDSISMLVTDGNGTSLMTQTEDGWTFSTSNIQSSVNAVSESLNSLTEEVGDVYNTVDILKQTVDDLGEIAEYVTITTYEDEPCIELGESDSDFKLRITNTRMMFTEGSSVLAYFTNQAFNSKKVVIEEELQQGGFVWKTRANGNLGLIWKGGNS